MSHTLAGAAIYAAGDADGASNAWPRLAAAVVLANAADLDLVPGLLIGHPNRFHQGVTHSLGGVLAVAALTAVMALVSGWRWPLRGNMRSILGTVAMVTALWSSHLLLDLLTADGSEPIGIPLWWPLAEGHVQLWPLFARGDKAAGVASPLGFLGSLVSWHNLGAVVREALFVGPVAWLAYRWRSRGSATVRP